MYHAQKESSRSLFSTLGFPEGVRSHPGHPTMSSCPWDCQPLSGRTMFCIYSTSSPRQVNMKL